MDMIWYLISVVFLITLYYVLIKPFNYWKSLGIPQYHILVSLREIILAFIPYRTVPDAVKKMYDDFPKSRYFGVYQFKSALVLRDPELIKQITVKDFDHFVDHMKIMQDDSEPIWGKNLFALEGDSWRDMRSTLSPSFTSSKMKIMFDLIKDYTKQFLEYLEEHSIELTSVDIYDIFTKFANDIIATAAFGYNCDSIRNPNNEFYLMGKELTTFKGFWTNVKFLFSFFFPNIAQKLGLRLFPKATADYFTTLITQNIETREKKGIVRPDMIHLLMEARKERSNFDNNTERNENNLDKKDEKRKKAALTNIDITAQALVFFFAGFDTVSSSMCFMAHELAVNVDIQERLQAEIDDTISECNGDITYDALQKMNYMDMVIAEALRKWPAAIVTDRVCTKSYTIQPIQKEEVSVTLNPGQVIWIPIFGIHRDPNIYPNPERFDPERFSTECRSNITSYQYLPFGVGPRLCIGNRFALMEMKLLFFYILSKFDITVTEKTSVPIEIGKAQFTLTAKNGFWLGLKPRNKM